MAFVYENPKTNPRLLERALIHLNGLKEPEKLLTELSSYHAFYYIAKYCNGDKADMLKFSTKSLEKIFIKALDQLYLKRDDFDLNQANISEFIQKPSDGEKCSCVLICILYSINIICKKSMVKYFI